MPTCGPPSSTIEPNSNEALGQRSSGVFGMNKSWRDFSAARRTLGTVPLPTASVLADYRYRMVVPIPKRSENREIPWLDETDIHMGTAEQRTKVLYAPLQISLVERGRHKGKNWMWTLFPIE